MAGDGCQRVSQELRVLQHLGQPLRLHLCHLLPPALRAHAAPKLRPRAARLQPRRRLVQRLREGGEVGQGRRGPTLLLLQRRCGGGQGRCA